MHKLLNKIQSLTIIIIPTLLLATLVLDVFYSPYVLLPVLFCSIACGMLVLNIVKFIEDWRLQNV